jgi:hypothetical protein
MYWTTKLLVIANRTIASKEIRDAIINRAAAGPVEVTLVAPASSGAGYVRACRTATAQRLEGAVQRLRDEGVPVEVIVGDPDPIVAVQDAWDPRRFDEVIVVTLPTGVSRWMAADLPHRVARLTGARVTHIVAPAEAAAPRSPSAIGAARRSTDGNVRLPGDGPLPGTATPSARRRRRNRIGAVNGHDRV